MSALEHEHTVRLTEPALPRQRIIRIVATLLAIAIVLALLQLVGVDPIAWVRALFRAMGAIPTPYVVAGIASQTINMMLVGLAYVTVWRAAYPGAKKLPIMQIATCFVVGIALNGVLPMSMGSFVMAFMFLAIIPGATAAGVASGFGVHQIFFAVAGVLTYGFLFWRISGALNETIGGISNHLPVLLLILIGLVIGVMVLLKAFKQKAIGAMENLKQGAAILQTPWRYLVGVLLLQVTAYGFELLTSFIFMRGYGIPAVLSEGAVLIAGGVDAEIQPTIERLATEHGAARAMLLGTGALDDDLPDLAAAGMFQRGNATLALGATAALLGEGFRPKPAMAAIAKVVVPGRLEVIGRYPLVVRDAAHNPEAAQVLARELPRMLGNHRPVIGVLALLADKDVDGVVAALAPCFDEVVVTATESPRALSAERLLEVVAAHGLRGEAVPDPVAALTRARFRSGAAGAVVVAGSLTLLEELAR